MDNIAVASDKLQWSNVIRCLQNQRFQKDGYNIMTVESRHRNILEDIYNVIFDDFGDVTSTSWESQLEWEFP